MERCPPRSRPAILPLALAGGVRLDRALRAFLTKVVGRRCFRPIGREAAFLVVSRHRRPRFLHHARPFLEWRTATRVRARWFRQPLADAGGARRS